MKKYLFALVLFSAPLFSQTAPITGFCEAGAAKILTQGLSSTNFAQAIIPSCIVTVYLTGTTNKATIYSDGNNTVLSNPFTASPSGQWILFAAINQGYDVQLSGGVTPNNYATPKTLTGLYPAQQTVIANISGQLNGTIPVATGTGAIGAQSHINEATLGVTTVTQPMIGPQINGTFTPAPGSTLQTTITAAGANSDILLSCGTYTIAGLTISNANVTLRAPTNRCVTIQSTNGAGTLVSGTNVSFKNITFAGATQNYTIEVSATAHGFHLENCLIQDGGTFGGAPAGSSALWIQAPNRDIWIDGNEFTGNGVTGATGYIVKTDGAAAGYVQNFHFRHNWIHDNISPDPLYAFDIANSEITDNTIDQGNICGGVNCNNPAGNGVGYSIAVYSQGYALSITTLTRVSGTVTAVLATAFAPTWPLQVGDQVFLETALLGTNGTDFNGVFAVASISVDRKTITWTQTGIPDDTGTGAGPPYGNGVLIPPLQNVTVSRNIITNSSGACIYFQGMSNLVTTDNNLTQCDLQSQAGGHPQSAIGLNGVWEGTISGNGIDGVGLTHGIAAQNAYFVTIAGNTIGNIPAGMGINIYDSAHLAVNGNTIHDAQTGIGTSAGTTPNCFHCSFAGNTIRMKANGGAYALSAADSQISITGGSIHAPSTGLSNSAIGLTAGTSQITVSGVTVNCQPDGATAATSTLVYGIRNFTGATANTIRNNTITGCNFASGAGVFDTGNDSIVMDNKITAGTFGILANAGNRQLIAGNIVWGNSSAINTTGSTGAVVQGNQTTQGAAPVWASFDFTLGTYTFGTNTTTTPEIMNLNSAVGHQRIFSFLTAGSARWGMTTESDAESGGNAGSSFSLRAFDDSGTTIDVPIGIARAAGSPVVFSRPVTVNNGTAVVYLCSGGTKDGDLVYKTTLCTGAGGTATATSLKVD